MNDEDASFYWRRKFYGRCCTFYCFADFAGKFFHFDTCRDHVHSRRMEAYFYFDIPEDQAICHFMGEVNETRHIWMRGEQAVLSPEWSIHSAAATHNYTFIWGMGGENLDYGDQDFSLITDLK